MVGSNSKKRQKKKASSPPSEALIRRESMDQSINPGKAVLTEESEVVGQTESRRSPWLKNLAADLRRSSSQLDLESDVCTNVNVGAKVLIEAGKSHEGCNLESTSELQATGHAQIFKKNLEKIPEPKVPKGNSKGKIPKGRADDAEPQKENGHSTLNKDNSSSNESLNSIHSTDSNEHSDDSDPKSGILLRSPGNFSKVSAALKAQYRKMREKFAKENPELTEEMNKGWDESAKVAGRAVPALDHHRPLLETLP